MSEQDRDLLRKLEKLTVQQEEIASQRSELIRQAVLAGVRRDYIADASHLSRSQVWHIANKKK